MKQSCVYNIAWYIVVFDPFTHNHLQFDIWLQVFEDANEAVKYCDLLEGGGQGCEGVAEIEASSVQRIKHFVICHCSFCCMKKLCAITFALFHADI